MNKLFVGMLCRQWDGCIGNHGRFGRTPKYMGRNIACQHAAPFHHGSFTHMNTGQNQAVRADKCVFLDYDFFVPPLMPPLAPVHVSKN